jgi:ribonuclease BN (tRNA processing enzyme)
VVSGDTAPAASIIEHCNGCDVLIHEVYSSARFREQPPEWQRYHSDFHTSTHELAEIASVVKPKLLILYHQLFWGSSEDELLAEIRERYDGQVVSGEDLGVY